MPIACRGIQNHAAALYASRHLVRADDFAEVKRCRCVLNREAGDRNVEDPTNLADTLTRQDFAAAVKDFGEPGVSYEKFRRLLRSGKRIPLRARGPPRFRAKVAQGLPDPAVEPTTGSPAARARRGGRRAAGAPPLFLPPRETRLRGGEEEGRPPPKEFGPETANGPPEGGE